MKYTFDFLGAGSAFTTEPGNFQSNVLMTAPSGKRLLIDCGGDVRWPLAQRGLSFKDIDAIYISHLHGDHVGGLEGFAFGTHWIPNHAKPKIFISETLAGKLWSDSLQGGLESLEGEYADMNTYFDVRAVGRLGTFEWEGIDFQMVQVVHVMSAFNIMPSYGLMFVANGKKVFFTADTQFCPHQISKMYDLADIIFHDCETAQFASGVHAHWKDLVTLPAETKKKMWLYHYQPTRPTQDNAAEAGFQGFVEPGQKWEF